MLFGVHWHDAALDSCMLECIVPPHFKKLATSRGENFLERIGRHKLRRQLRHRDSAAARHQRGNIRVLHTARADQRHDLLLADRRAQQLGVHDRRESSSCTKPAQQERNH